MKLNKETLYWSRGCLTGANEQGEKCCQSVKGCHKLTVYDWLKEIPADRTYDIVEVRFKNTRKVLYRNASGLDLKEGDIISVEASPGHDIGIVSSVGPVAEIKLRKTGQTPDTADLKKIYRVAKSADIEKWQEAVSLEYPTMIQARKFAVSLGLSMKIGNVEYQGDKTKAIFYYIADERVDFRELIKIMADSFRIRIEMRQIGARQEAGLIGGIGPCGRELCCAQWMTNFVSVSTNSARYQDLSVNPLKLAGQCGKLKCCLNYEIDTYLDAIKNIPAVKEIQTAEGPLFLLKVDALRSTMLFSREPGSYNSTVLLTTEKVRQVAEMNKKGVMPEVSFEDTKEESNEFMGAEVEDSLTRFDKKKGRRPQRRNESSADEQRSRGNNQRRSEPRRPETGRNEPRRNELPRRGNNRDDRDNRNNIKPENGTANDSVNKPESTEPRTDRPQQRQNRFNNSRNRRRPDQNNNNSNNE